MELEVEICGLSKGLGAALNGVIVRWLGVYRLRLFENGCVCSGNEWFACV